MIDARSLNALAPVVAGAAIVLLGLTWVGAPRVRSQEEPGDVERGRRLFVESCVSCHGAEGQGTQYGPSLEDAGAAAANFQLTTGRMPLADAGGQPVRKPPAFEPGRIADLVAYVASIGDGPPIPEVSVGAGDLAQGRDVFINNCAPCHGANANGGAVGDDALAPTLLHSEPLVVAEAILVGPGQMPAFDFDDEERNSVVRFVEFLGTKRDPGGADIGGVGPVPEGFVAWTVGGVGVLITCLFVGHRRRPGKDRRA
ncbi:MAG: c-type cytochrome [Actinomycetota bacterium]